MARFFTTTTTIYYLLALVILIITPFPSSSSIQSVNADGTKSYIVTLKQACDTKSHYEWVEQQQNKKTVRMNTDEAQNADYNSVLRTFSIGKVNGYAATLEESWVQNVLQERSEVQSVQPDESVYVLAPVRKRQDDGKTEDEGKSEDDGKADDGDDGKADDGDDGKADDGDDGKADDGDNGKSEFIVAKDPLSNIDMMDTTADPLFDNSYTFPKEAGEGVKVFVVDTGVRVTHNEFEGRAKMAKAVCAGCPNTDDNGHGTHVSGIVAGRTFGVAKKASILGIKVLDAKGAGKNSDVIGGLQFVEDEKKANAKEIFVVNMSLGGKQNDAVNDAVKALTDEGVHVMVAAGNEAQDACNTSPASELSAVTVGAVEDNALTITDFSNFGKCVDIFAPGRDIPSCGIDNDDDVAVFSGTSQATPHVAGAAALILSKQGDMSPADLAKFMTGNGLENEITFLEGTEDGSPNTFASIRNYFS